MKDEDGEGGEDVHFNTAYLPELFETDLSQSRREVAEKRRGQVNVTQIHRSNRQSISDDNRV